jgi:orotidine-5'-phosphate decarboxylase
MSHAIPDWPQLADKTVPTSKNIPTAERLVFPLDVGDFDQARQLVHELGDAVHFYKLGLELLLADGGFGGQYGGMVDWLVGQNKKVMVDLKIFDIERTVTAAVRQLGGHGATFVTVHGNDAILRAAVNAKNGIKILAVTVLTSLDQKDIEDLGFRGVSTEDLVFSRARRALEIGCDGVISSGMEAERLRQGLGDRFLIVVPGIRPVENREIDDQKRVVDVEDAFRKGADYIIVGRPIRNAASPRAAAEQYQQRIQAFFSSPAQS